MAPYTPRTPIPEPPQQKLPAVVVHDSRVPAREVYGDEAAGPMQETLEARMRFVKYPFREASKDAFMGYRGLDKFEAVLARKAYKAGKANKVSKACNTENIKQREWSEVLSQACDGAVTDDLMRDLFPTLADDPVEQY
ncbi:hypothetical protein F5Y06DRAFT_255643, partial [Hypoxylon sp. FL0890]